ncbi:hypothetical protein SAE01_40520 [Segetibacter aerophilus]|uniref:Serine protease n=1 Tax=Segetibacter aerophilus TaxID=670293 RepID=A0A512BHU7_9BACT|nr:hypothetical protein SAE01_40520 [Segetibacter aerophilus]
MTGIGTAFFVTNKNRQACLVTNRHNVDRDYMEPTAKYKTFRLTKLTVDNRQNNPATGLPTKIIELDISNYSELHFSETYENDIACIIRVQINGGQQQKIEFPIDYAMIADIEKINSKLSVCDFVAFPGFPDWYDKLNNNPILRTGTIASDPRFNYSNKKESIGECIAYEAFSYGGSSGSPVFAIQKGFPIGAGLQAGEDFYRPIMLVGINAGHLLVDGYDKHHSGISLMYKSSAILEIINK